MTKDDVKITLDATTVGQTVKCPHCDQEFPGCNCSKFVCPVHGIVCAVKNPSEDKKAKEYKCQVADCTTTRSKNELEFPHE
jgi:hypothetical protein